MHWSALSQLCEHSSCTVDSNTGREGSLVPRPHVGEKSTCFLYPMRPRNEAKGGGEKGKLLLNLTYCSFPRYLCSRSSMKLISMKGIVVLFQRFPMLDGLNMIGQSLHFSASYSLPAD